MAAQSAALPTPSLWRSFSWSLIGNLVAAGCQWAMIILIARLGTPEMVGRFGLALAITAPVILLANLNLRTVQATDARCVYRFEEYFALRLVALALAFVVVVGITVVSGLSRHTALVVTLVMIAKMFDSVSDVIYGFMQQQERMNCVSISRSIQGVLQFAAMGVLLSWTGDIIWAIGALVIASAAVTFGYDLPCAASLLQGAACGIRRPDGPSHAVPGDERSTGTPRRGAAARPARFWNAPRPQLSARSFVSLVRLTFPLGGVAALGAINANMPRYFLQQVGEREVGIFSAMWSLMVAGGLVIAALIQSAAPRMSRAYVTSLSAFKRLLWGLIIVGLANGVIGLLVSFLFGRTILTVLYGTEYAEQPALFVWLMAVAALLYVASALGGAVAAARRFRPQLPVYVAMVLTNAVACGWLVPLYGMRGAAWAYLASTLVFVLGLAAITLEALRNPSAAGLPLLESREAFSSEDSRGIA